MLLERSIKVSQKGLASPGDNLGIVPEIHVLFPPYKKVEYPTCEFEIAAFKNLYALF